MAYSTSSIYKQKIYSPNTQQTLQIIINDDLSLILNNDYIMSLKEEDSCFETDSFSLGSAVIQKLVLKIDNYGLPIATNLIRTLMIKSGVYIDDEHIEWVPLGTFDVVKTDTTSSEYTTFTIYDYMNRFDTDGFDASLIVPCTRYRLVQSMCEAIDVQLGSLSFLNSDVMVTTYDSSISPKIYLSFISERAGGFSKIGRDNKLYIKSFSDVDEINLDEVADKMIGDYKNGPLQTISKVIYEDALRKFEFGNELGTTVWLSEENILSITENEVENIYNSLVGLSFQSIKISNMLGDQAYDTGDIISFNGLRTFLQKSWEYNNGFYGKCETTLNKTEKLTNVKRIDNDAKIRRIQTTLDDVAGKVLILIEETDGNIENISTIMLDLSSIVTRVTNTEQSLENDYMTSAEVNALNDTNVENIEMVKSTVETSLSSTEFQINVINDKIANGISKVVTNTGYTFDDNGLNISKTGEEMNNTMDNKGMYVKRDNDEVLGADNTGVRAENLWAKKYLQIGSNARLEDYKTNRTGCFHIGGDS